MFNLPLAEELPHTEIHASPFFVEEKIESIRGQIASQATNHPAVLEGYDNLIQALLQAKEEDPSLDLQKVLAAISYSAERHQSQTRKDLAATPYIIHPMGVAQQLIEIGKIHDADILTGALLHDVIEDTFSLEETDKGYTEISFLFGETVAGYVREVSDDKALPKEERKRLQIEHAPHKSYGATAIKLSDKLYNLKDLSHSPPPDWPQERTDLYFSWAEKVVQGLPDHHPALKEAVQKTIDAYRAK